MRYCIGCLQEECACAEEAFVDRRNRELEEEELKANRYRVNVFGTINKRRNRSTEGNRNKVFRGSFQKSQ